MQLNLGKFNLSNYTDCLVVTDGTLQQLYNIHGDNVFVIPCGECAKNFATVQQLCSWFLSKNLRKNQTVVAVGGGSVGDTVGFACSIYKRGVNLLHVPTTLLAMVDSSVGGKTAIDLDGVKNAVGSFHLGDVLLDVDFLNTLPPDQMQNGHGEILKYRMLTSQIDEFFAQGNIQDTIWACANWKQAVCELDPFDEGIRQRLNFGHTIGHAMELTLGIPHGLAVLNGIYYETLLAHKLGLCDKNYLTKWQNEVSKLVDVCPTLTDSMLDATLQDKKNDNQLVTFVLPNKFERIQLPLAQLKDLLLK